MKKIIRTLAALTLVVMLAASLSAAAWADGDNADGSETGSTATTTEFTKTANVTINGLMAGEIVNAYQVVWYAKDFHGYEYKPNFKTYLEGKAGIGNDIGKYFAGLQASSAVRELIDGYIEAYKTSLTATATATVNPDAASVMFNNLAPGYYIFTVTTNAENSRIYLPMSVFARVDGENLVVTGGDSVNGIDGAIVLMAKAKNGPTIEKQVYCKSHNKWETQTDASVGDTCSFYVRVEIPEYSDVTTVNLSLEDTMTNLIYNSDTAKVYSSEPTADGRGDNLVANAITGTPEYNNGVLTLNLNYDVLKGKNTVYLFYQATVTSSAAATGESSNKAVLNYSIGSGDDLKTAVKTTNVYNYAFNLEKVDAKDATTPVVGAKFTIYTDKECTEAISFVQNGNYYVKATGTNAVNEIPADFTVNGLGSGTYYVKETTTPRGYFAPEEAFVLTLSPVIDTVDLIPEHQELSQAHSSFSGQTDNDKELSPAVGNEVVAKDRIMNVTLRNATTPVLPTTGGAGTVMFTVGGVAVMVLAAVLFLRRKREE